MHVSAFAGDLLELCIDVAVSEAGAQPATLALRTVLTDPESSADARRVASMKLNAIYHAAVASGRMEFLRIQAIQSQQVREAARDRQMQQLLLIQQWNLQHPNSFYPFPLPR